MADMSATRFCLIGRFTAFLPGEKSPYQGISLEAVRAEGSSSSSLTQALSTHEPVPHQILLSKDLRRMMYRYLAPQDWVRVVGKQTLNQRNGQLEWKAAEISKLSACQVNRLKPEMISPQRANAPQSVRAARAARAVRVLICQESGCRQRGSLLVRDAVTHIITEAKGSSKIAVQSTGCMKRCKLGPNMVMLPGGSYSQVTAEEGRSLVQQMLDSKIVRDGR